MSLLTLAGVLTVFLVVIAVMVAVLQDVLAATVVFAAYSLGMAILWVTMQAPDVALTEAAVGAGVTTSLFLVAINRGSRSDGSGVFVQDVSASAVLTAAAAFVALVITIPALSPVGSPDTPPFQRVTPYYLEQAVPQLGIQNAVTAILAGYRAFDTLGEVVVVIAAGVAILVVADKEVR